MGLVTWNQADVALTPPKAVGGTVRPPGSKSITNRYLTCLALADGRSVLHQAGLCDDTDRMVAGLRALGLKVDSDSARRSITVFGRSGVLPVEEATINAGLAGTAMRFLTALATLAQGDLRLDGAPRMRERPIGPLIDVLRGLGARIEYERLEGFPPLLLQARGLDGGSVAFQKTPSSQYVSAIVMTAPYARQDVLLETVGGVPSRPYLDMTLDVMRELGVDVVEDDSGERFIIPASQQYRAGDYTVEPDASGATYLWGAAAIMGATVRVADLTRASRQGDAAFVDVLAEMGCTVNADDAGISVTGPPIGALRAVDVDLNQMPDTVQTLAAIALFADGPTNIRNVGNLRIKETDRIAALEQELTKLGAEVTTRDDGLTITPPAELQPAAIDTYDDHRMAMSLALVGLRQPGVIIREAGCVSKSYPDFFDDLARLCRD